MTRRNQRNERSQGCGVHKSCAPPGGGSLRFKPSDQPPSAAPSDALIEHLPLAETETDDYRQLARQATTVVA